MSLWISSKLIPVEGLPSYSEALLADFISFQHNVGSRRREPRDNAGFMFILTEVEIISSPFWGTLI